MPLPETSVDQVLEALRAAATSGAENQRLLKALLESRRQEDRPAAASNATIHAGGITNAFAVCLSISTILMFLMFGIWTMWQIAEVKGQQEAWIQVWQSRISTEDKKG